MVPVLVIPLSPLLIEPKLLVIEPASNAPVVVNPVIVVILFCVVVDIVADTGWLNVTTPLAAIAIASASLAEPICPPSAIVIPPLWTER